MSTPYNPTGSNDNNEQPDYLTDRSAESSEPTTEFSRGDASSEWGTGDSSSAWGSDSAAGDNEWGAQSQQAQQPQSYNQYGQPQYGQSDYSQGDYSQSDYSQGGYSQAGYAQSSQSQGQPQYGQTDYSQPQYGAQQSQYQPQGQSQYSQTDYSQAQFGAQQGQYQPQGQYGVPQGQFQQPGKPRKGDGDGFFKALFDFSFNRFITIDFVKVIYAIVLAFIALGWVVGLFASLSGFADSVGTGFLLLFGYLILGTAVAFLWLVFARIGLESYVAMVKTAQNTSKLVQYEKDKA